MWLVGVSVILAVLLSSSTTRTWANPNHQTSTHYHTHRRALPLTAVETGMFQTLRGWYREQLLPYPQWDAGLQRSARRLALGLAVGRHRSLSHTLVESALWLEGRSPHQIRMFAMAFRDEETLQQSLRRSLASHLAGHRPNVWAMAIVAQRVQVAVALFARQGVRLAPLARLWRQGEQVVLRGHVLSGFSRPRVVVGLPQGHVIRPRTTVLQDGSFSAQWPVRWHGAMQVQVLVENEKGPWVSSQLELWGWGESQDPQRVLQQLLARYQQNLQSFFTPTAKVSPVTSRRWTVEQAARRLWQIVNQHRKNQGLSWLRRHPDLDALAYSHAKDMVNEHFFAHTSPQQGSFATRFQSLRWRRVALARENIVVAFSPNQAYQFLYQSPSHRSNLLEPKFQWTGLGAAVDKKGALFFVQVFVALSPRR